MRFCRRTWLGQSSGADIDGVGGEWEKNGARGVHLVVGFVMSRVRNACGVANATRTPPRVLVTKMRSSNCRAIIRQWKKVEQGCSWRVGPTNRWRIYWEGIGESSGAAEHAGSAKWAMHATHARARLGLRYLGRASFALGQGSLLAGRVGSSSWSSC